MSNILYACGILFYTKTNDNVYFLLGKSNENKWSDFGGKCELSDKGDTFYTASREAWEETLGCIYDQEHIRCKIKNQNQHILSKTQGGKPYYMYILYIPYSNIYRERFLSTRKFLSKIVDDSKFYEISDIKWVSEDTLRMAIDNKSTIKLRYVFCKNLQENMKQIKSIIDCRTL